MRLLLLSVLVCLCVFASAEEEGGNRTLILLDSWSIRETHSKYFKFLKGEGNELTFKLATDKSLALFKFGSMLYDNLVLFCPSIKEFGGDLSVQEILNFVDEGGNVIIGADTTIEEPIREIAVECGFEFDEAGANVIDHLNFDVSDSGKHTMVVADKENLVSSPLIVGSPKGRSMLFEGVGLVSDPENPLTIDILHASSSAYSYQPDEAITEYPHAVGKSTLLLAALQARNNARVLFSGSLSFFSDELWESSVTNAMDETAKPSQSANEEVSKSITQWAFRRNGVLRIKKVVHHKVGEKNPPEAYQVLEQVYFGVAIEEFIGGKWVPFKGTDVQLEFVRIDPFVRTTLKEKDGIHSTTFKVPDVYGVYQFKVRYQRIGYSYLNSATQMSVRPLSHTQYERFIGSAYPYYVSAFSMMGGVMIFSLVYLHHAEPTARPKTE